MPFTDQDRNMLVATHTIVERAAKDIQANEDEIKVLHGRINTVRNLYGAIAAGLGGALAYMKIKLGG